MDARVDARLKVTGAATYAAEHPLEGLLQGVIVNVNVNTTAARGRVSASATDVARTHPGVLHVLTDFSSLRLAHSVTELAFYSQPIAVVVATTAEAAAHGASLVEAAYDPRPPLTDFGVGRRHARMEGLEGEDALQPLVFDESADPRLESAEAAQCGESDQVWVQHRERRVEVGLDAAARLRSTEVVEPLVQTLVPGRFAAAGEAFDFRLYGLGASVDVEAAAVREPGVVDGVEGVQGQPVGHLLADCVEGPFQQHNPSAIYGALLG